MAGGGLCSWSLVDAQQFIIVTTEERVEPRAATHGLVLNYDHVASAGFYLAVRQQMDARVRAPEAACLSRGERYARDIGVILRVAASARAQSVITQPHRREGSDVAAVA